MVMTPHYSSSPEKINPRLSPPLLQKIVLYHLIIYSLPQAPLEGAQVPGSVVGRKQAFKAEPVPLDI